MLYLLALCLVACGTSGQGEQTGTSGGESSTTTVAGNPMTVDTAGYALRDSYGEWFLSKPEWPLSGGKDLPAPGVSEEHKSLQLKTPGKVVKTVENVTITVNFFKELYRFGEALQVRVTIKNDGDETFTGQWHSMASTVGDNEGTIAQYYPFLNEQATSARDVIEYESVPARQTLEFEYVFFIDDSFAVDGLLFYRYGGIAPSEPSMENPYSVEVPLEVISG